MSIIEHTQHISESEDGSIEIRFSSIAAFIRRSRRKLIASIVVGAVLGAVYAYTLPNQYTSQITVLPELQSRGAANLGNLGSLAGLAGIDVSGMGGGSDAIKPDLYPTILTSVPFALSLFKQPVYQQSTKQAISFELYWKKRPGSFLLSWLPSAKSAEEETLLDSISQDGALQLSEAQENMKKALNERVSAFFDKKSGVLTITSTMPDPVIAAKVAVLSLEYLNNYVTTYRTEKARREVSFLTDQVAQAKRRYQSAEYELSAYRDKNRSVYLNTAKIEEQRIQAEFLLSQELYNSLSKQAEMAKIKIQEETPVFKVLEPAQIPLRKSGPRRLTIVFGFMISFLFVTSLFLVIKEWRQMTQEI